jgi:hypothetical protein
MQPQQQQQVQDQFASMSLEEYREHLQQQELLEQQQQQQPQRPRQLQHSQSAAVHKQSHMPQQQQGHSNLRHAVSLASGGGSSSSSSAAAAARGSGGARPISPMRSVSPPPSSALIAKDTVTLQDFRATFGRMAQVGLNSMAYGNQVATAEPNTGSVDNTC